MDRPGSRIRVDTEVLRQFARSCTRSADRVRDVVRSSVDFPSIIPYHAWDGGGMAAALALQSALDDMRRTYNSTRNVILGRLSALASDLDSTGERLREAADGYDQADQTARDELQLWP